MKDREIMTPRQVAEIFGVNPKTVSRWAVAKRIPAFKTPGNEWRFRRSQMESLINAGENYGE